MNLQQAANQLNTDFQQLRERDMLDVGFAKNYRSAAVRRADQQMAHDEGAANAQKRVQGIRAHLFTDKPENLVGAYAPIYGAVARGLNENIAGRPFATLRTDLALSDTTQDHLSNLAANARRDIGNAEAAILRERSFWRLRLDASELLEKRRQIDEVLAYYNKEKALLQGRQAELQRLWQLVGRTGEPRLPEMTGVERRIARLEEIRAKVEDKINQKNIPQLQQDVRQGFDTLVSSCMRYDPKGGERIVTLLLEAVTEGESLTPGVVGMAPLVPTKYKKLQSYIEGLRKQGMGPDEVKGLQQVVKVFGRRMLLGDRMLNGNELSRRMARSLIQDIVRERITTLAESNRTLDDDGKTLSEQQQMTNRMDALNKTHAGTPVWMRLPKGQKISIGGKELTELRGHTWRVDKTSNIITMRMDGATVAIRTQPAAVAEGKEADTWLATVIPDADSKGNRPEPTVVQLAPAQPQDHMEDNLSARTRRDVMHFGAKIVSPEQPEQPEGPAEPNQPKPTTPAGHTNPLTTPTGMASYRPGMQRQAAKAATTPAAEATAPEATPSVGEALRNGDIRLMYRTRKENADVAAGNTPTAEAVMRKRALEDAEATANGMWTEKEIMQRSTLTTLHRMLDWEKQEELATTDLNAICKALTAEQQAELTSKGTKPRHLADLLKNEQWKQVAEHIRQTTATAPAEKPAADDEEPLVATKLVPDDAGIGVGSVDNAPAATGMLDGSTNPTHSGSLADALLQTLQGFRQAPGEVLQVLTQKPGTNNANGEINTSIPEPKTLTNSRADGGAHEVALDWMNLLASEEANSAQAANNGTNATPETAATVVPSREKGEAEEAETLFLPHFVRKGRISRNWEAYIGSEKSIGEGKELTEEQLQKLYGIMNWRRKEAILAGYIPKDLHRREDNGADTLTSEQWKQVRSYVNQREQAETEEVAQSALEATEGFTQEELAEREKFEIASIPYGPEEDGRMPTGQVRALMNAMTHAQKESLIGEQIPPHLKDLLSDAQWQQMIDEAKKTMR